MGCPEPDTFNALVSDQLDSTARAALVDHAASCDECHRLLDALLSGLLATVPGAPTKASSSSEPDRVGRYVIERRIGAGAMGVVYAARDPELERRVAIKVLRGGGSAARLRREAQLLARLHHPNVVAVYDVGEHDGQTFVAMALVDGENLRSWEAKPQPLDAVLRVIREAATGLAAAHAADLIHRDLKPDNIFVAKDGSVQVGDFGLARSDGELDPAASAQGPLDLTQTGMVLGTPAYMAPEHAAGEPTAASDQFSFCVTAWEAIYGTRPFAAKTYAELRDQIVARKLAAPATARKVPARVHAALERGLRANPAERFPSIDALRAALAPRRRRWPWIAAAVTAAGVATALAMHGSSNPCAATAHELDAIWGSAAQTKLASAKPIVDAYTRDWLVLRRDACAAHDAAGDLRTDCLERARGALESLVATTDPTGDADLLHRAALALPPLDDCRSPLQGSASPIQQVEGEALRTRVASTEIRVTLAGTDGIAELRELLATATAIGYEPAIVTASVSLGDAYARDSQADTAAGVMRHALAIAEASHDDLGVARVATALGPVLIALGKLDEARAIVELASAAIARTGGDPDLEIRVTGIRAQLAAAAGDHATAIDLANGMIGPMTARTGAGSVEVASLYVLLAREYSAAGRMDEAARAMEQARFDDLGRAQGSGMASLLAVASLSSKISAAFLKGQSSRAIELSRELGALGAELHEPAVELQAALALARAYEFASDGPMMVEAFRALLDRLDREPHGGAPDVRAEALEGIGRGWLAQGKPAQAIDSLRAAVAVDAAGGPTLADLSTSASVALGDALVDTGKPHDARVLIEPVVRALVDDPNAMIQRRGGAEFVLARALWDDGGAADRERARALAADAARDLEAAIRKANAATNAHLAPRLEAIRAWQKRRS